MNKEKSTPITRVNMFFSEEDFELEQSFGREAIEADGNFTIILYRVDRQMSEFDDLYGEASKGGIRFYPPVELKVVPIVDEAENKTYNQNGSARYLQDGNFVFGIYSQQLKENNVEISYGDYIGYPVSEKEIRYFSVVDDGYKNYDNKHTIMGFKSAFRTIKCVIVDETEFSAR